MKTTGLTRAKVLEGNQENDLSLLRRIRDEGDSESREDMVKKYLPMVRYIVKRQNISWPDFDDYLQEGTIGLLKAIDEYDPEHYPIKFSTFAYICIIRRIYNALKQAYGRKILPNNQIISLNSFLNEEDTRTLIDSIPDLSAEPSTQIEEALVGQRLKTVLEAYLSPVEFRVVQMIWSGYSLKEIHQTLSLSNKVIDNARTRARLKLKKVLFEYGSLLDPRIPMKIRKRKDLAIKVV